MRWLLVLGLVACGGGDKDTDSAAPPTTTGGTAGGIDTGPPPRDLTNLDVQPIVDANCGPCHLGGQVTSGLNLDDIRGAIGLSSGQLPGLFMVRCDFPEQSYLLMKVKDSPEISGQKMPQGGALTDDEIEMLEVWIDEGCTDADDPG
ncbi:MAG: hypothetical protein ACI8PZ_003043 [Myxococcota bacterium]|jgi:hypothetical protein